MTATTHQEPKVVTRFEVWCDVCPWTAEFADGHEARSQRRQHEKWHAEAAEIRAEP